MYSLCYVAVVLLFNPLQAMRHRAWNVQSVPSRAQSYRHTLSCGEYSQSYRSRFVLRVEACIMYRSYHVTVACLLAVGRGVVRIAGGRCGVQSRYSKHGLC